MTVTEAPWDSVGLKHYEHDIRNWQKDEETGKYFHEGTEWRTITPFTATLKLEGMQRGRSSAYFIWKNVETGDKLPMFMSEMVNLATKSFISNGFTRGTFKVVKRGQNYGIALAE